MTYVEVLPILRSRNWLTAKALRQLLMFIGLVAVGSLTAEVSYDLKHPRYIGGSFGEGFSDAFDIERWEYDLPFKTQMVITGHSARLHNGLFGSVRICNW